MGKKKEVLIPGASCGSLLAIKLLLAGHDVKLVCLPEEAGLINLEGIRVRMPVKDRDELVEVASSGLPGAISVTSPGDVDAAGEISILSHTTSECLSGQRPSSRELLSNTPGGRL